MIFRNGVQSNKWSKIIKFKLHPHHTQKKASNNTSRYDGLGLLQIANYTILNGRYSGPSQQQEMPLKML